MILKYYIVYCFILAHPMTHAHHQRLRLPCSWVLLGSMLITGPLHAQRAGSTTSGTESPHDVKVSELAASVLQSDVDLFTGRYSASHPMGTVSTPGGLSFTLSLQYSPTVIGGTTPALLEGLPYGVGWSDNVPTITVSNNTRHAYDRIEETNIQNSPTANIYNVPTFNAIDPTWEGEGSWYAPYLNIPGVASGRAVFRGMEKGVALFVLNAFEEDVELRFHGGNWTVTAPNG